MSILEIKNVSKNFGGLKALSDVNLSVEENTVHAIIGPNGAGKSTLLNSCFAHRDGAFQMNALAAVGKQGDIRAQAEAILEDVGMLDKHHMNAASLSRGDKRRLEMAMCLVQEPKLLLLDEPTAGMARADTNNTIDLLKEIKEKRDITMAIIEHDMHVVFSMAERITVLAQGTPLVEETPENIKGHPKVREAYLGEAQV